MRSSMRRRRVGTVLLTAFTLVTALVQPASAQPGHARATAAALKVSTKTRRAGRLIRGASADVVVNGWGDESGYHLEVGRGSTGYAWREIALLRPAGLDEQSWTGYQCVSGDGRYAAVAIEPTSAVTIQAARDRGAFAYSVDLASGRVRPLASGVALKYYTPGCGTGDDAVFTLNLGSDDAHTEVLTADLARGTITQSVALNGQVTSTVPTSTGLVGVAGSDLVWIHPTHGGAGRTTVIASTSGTPFDLRPSSDGGVNLLAAAPASTTATAMHEHAGALASFASGPLTRLHLFQGRRGRAVLTGATNVSAASGAVNVAVVDDHRLSHAAAGASLDGGALLADPLGKATDPLLFSALTNRIVRDRRAASRVSATLSQPTFRPAGTSITVRVPAATGGLQPHGDAAASSSTARSRAAARTASPQIAPPSDPNQSPTCAVPPLDEAKQVMQPSPAQVAWASQMDEQGKLTGSAYARPANFDNMGFASYSPSDDFPPIALEHPSSSTWNSVPPAVYNAIMAQESNYDQASWHAPEGTAGDPLISDYYGAHYDIKSIDYSSADCGYGIGQVTDGMHKSDTSLSARGQVKVAVDYQENIAAGLQILETTWNQLYDDGIIANNGDPKDLENWFFAAWGYNSGIQPTGKYDQGCTPGPSCTGPDGTWGMGWANNPANPDYPPNRDPYLQDTYADAAHPSDWSYEERIMGWMASPILKGNSRAYSTPTYHGHSWLQLPAFTTFCSLSANHCDPTKTNTSQTDAGHCMLNDYECWWHQPATWISNCATTCATSAYQYSSGNEPLEINSNPIACNVDRSSVPSSAVVVDDESSPYYNLMGCSGTNWTSGGTFNYQFGTNSSGDPIGAIDTHQLGTGLGGHDLFTHTEDGSNPALINTGTWTPTLPKLQYYKIKIHLPYLGANATNVIYTVNPGGGVSPWKIRVNQAWQQDTWATIGTFAMQNGGNVVLTNQSSVVGSGNESLINFDVAFDAIAFIPEGGTPGQPIGGPPTVQDEPKGSNPAWVQCGCAQRTAGDPVDTSTGYYGDQTTDLATPGRGLPLEFTRTYTEGTADPAGPNGSSAVNGPFGYGWTDSYNLSTATNSTTGAVTVTQEDGSQVAFTNSSGTYTATEPRDDATLVKSGSTYVYTRRGRDIYTFDATSGHLLAEQDIAGKAATTPYQTTLAYNSSGQLSTITDPAGRRYTLTWSGGHVTQLSDTAGRTVTYTYDTSNDLTGVYGVGTTRSPSLLSNDLTSYGYNTAKHLLTSIRNPKNQGGASTAVTAMTYDSSERVLTQTDPDGNITSFTYGPSSSPSLSAGQTLITDPAGHKTLDTYSNGLLTSETTGYGGSAPSTTAYTYDPITLGISTKVDPNGNTTTYSYDDHGNRTSSSDALGYTTNYAYDSAGDLTETVDPNGVATINTYDQAGHVKTSSGTNNGAFTYGDLTSTTVTQATNIVDISSGNYGTAPTRTLNYYYDDAAHPADRSRFVDATGNTTSYTYDSAGDLASTADPVGDKSLQGWDTSRGWLTSTVSPTGTAAGTTTGCTPPATGCITYGHDAYGNVTTTTDPLGHVGTVTWDADGNKTSSTDDDGNKTSYTYDPADQLTVTTRADGSTLKTSYNADGTRASTTDAAGNVTTYTYDDHGRLAKTTNPDNRATTAGYDKNGNVTTVVNPAGQTTTMTYDADGHESAVTYSDGTTPNVTAITYDPDGRRTSMTDGTGTSTWTYDVFGELTASTNGAGANVGYQYSPGGNLTAITYPDGTTVTYAYDNAERLSTATDAAGGKTTFGYTADSLTQTIAYPNGTTVTDGYNTADQQTSTTVKNGSSTLGALTYGRDNAGQLAAQTPTGALAGTATTYAYTSLQQVKTATAGSSTSGYGYDPADNITGNAGTTAKYDPADQLCWSTAAVVTGTPACTSPPSGATSYTYDTNGRRTKTTPATGTASTYTYNQANQLTAATTASGSGSYHYDGTGLRTSKTVGTTTTNYTWGTFDDRTLLLTDGTTDYLYGPDDQPIEQTGTAGTSYFVADQLGDTIALTNSAGTIAGTYAYNTYGKATAHTGTATTALQYGSGYTDPETGLIYLQNRYYDPSTGTFLTSDPALALTGDPYSYASDNPSNAIDPIGLWGWNPISDIGEAASDAGHAVASAYHDTIGKHWRGIVQGLAIAGAVIGGAACVAATAGLCGTVVGTLVVTSAIGGASGAGVYAASSGSHTLLGYEQAVGFGALGGLAIAACSTFAVGVCATAAGRAAVGLIAGGSAGAAQYLAGVGCPSDFDLRDLLQSIGYGALSGVSLER